MLRYFRIDRAMKLLATKANQGRPDYLARGLKVPRNCFAFTEAPAATKPTFCTKPYIPVMALVELNTVVKMSVIVAGRVKEDTTAPVASVEMKVDKLILLS